MQAVCRSARLYPLEDFLLTLSLPFDIVLIEAVSATGLAVNRRVFFKALRNWSASIFLFMKADVTQIVLELVSGTATTK